MEEIVQSISKKYQVSNLTSLTESQWIEISTSFTLSEEFIRTYHKQLHWYEITKYQEMSMTLWKSSAGPISGSSCVILQRKRSKDF